MNLSVIFLLKCFGIGASVAAAVGPIFVLTFNRAASKGWLAGFLTGLGSALADACYFVLGLLGVLEIVFRFPAVLRALYLVGGALLVGVSFFLFFTGLRTPADRQRSPHYGVLLVQSFGMTFANPTVLLFFIAVSARVLSEVTADISLGTVGAAVSALLAGSCTVYALTCTAGWLLGRRMPTWLLQRISQGVALGVGGFGLFLLISGLL